MLSFDNDDEDDNFPARDEERYFPRFRSRAQHSSPFAHLAAGPAWELREARSTETTWQEVSFTTYDTRRIDADVVSSIQRALLSRMLDDMEADLSSVGHAHSHTDFLLARRARRMVPSMRTLLRTARHQQELEARSFCALCFALITALEQELFELTRAVERWMHGGPGGQGGGDRPAATMGPGAVRAVIFEEEEEEGEE